MSIGSPDFVKTINIVGDQNFVKVSSITPTGTESGSVTSMWDGDTSTMFSLQSNTAKIVFDTLRLRNFVSALFHVGVANSDAGAGAWDSGTVKLDVSDDNSTWTEIDSEAFNNNSGSADLVNLIGGNFSGRYIRVRVLVTGGAGGGTAILQLRDSNLACQEAQA